MDTWMIAVGVVLVLAILGWMIWRFVSTVPAVEREPSPIRRGIPAIDREKVDANIRRFTLAIEQDLKGGDRLKELKANLRHWKLMDAALRERGE